MRQSKTNIDDLVDDESASVDTGRTNFADMQTTKKSYPGLRAFIAVMGLLCIGSMGWFVYSQAKHKEAPKDEVTAAQKAAGASSLPGRKFGDPSDGKSQGVPAPSTVASGSANGPPSDADVAPNDPEAAARAAAAAEAARQQKYEADVMKRR